MHSSLRRKKTKIVKKKKIKRHFCNRKKGKEGKEKQSLKYLVVNIYFTDTLLLLYSVFLVTVGTVLPGNVLSGPCLFLQL